MTATNLVTAGAFDGTAARETCLRPRLVLIEGGSAGARDARATKPASRLALKQYACAFACSAVVVLALCAASLMTDALGVRARAQELSLLPEVTVVVRDGDTLWDIAESLGVDAPTREVVSWIAERNGVSASLVVGQPLVVPVSGA